MTYLNRTVTNIPKMYIEPQKTLNGHSNLGKEQSEVHFSPPKSKAIEVKENKIKNS